MAILYLTASIPPGSWVGRIPDIKASLAADDARWGLANSVGAVGELAGLLVIAILIGRLSTRRIAVLAAFLVVVTSPLLAYAPTLRALAAALLAWMVSAKALGATMGALALAEQRRAGRILMARYDAVYSIGMLTGGALAWGCIRLGIAPQVQFAATNLILLAGLIASIRELDDEDLSPSAGQSLGRRLRHRLQPGLMFLGGIALLASVVDSVMSQWGALMVTAVAHGEASWGALAYPAVMATKIVVLVLIDRLVHRIGWSRVLYLSAALSSVAIIVATLTVSPAIAVIGLAAVGAGTAVLGPMINTAATDRPGISAGEARTVLEFGEVPAYLAMPAVTGLLATAVGVGSAVRITTVAAILGCVMIVRIGRVGDYAAIRSARSRRNRPAAPQ